MCGTCRFCLGFFYACGAGSLALFCTIIYVFNLYGGMPPIYAYVAGFWMQITANLIAIYLIRFVIRTVGRGLGRMWVHRYVYIVLLILVVFFAAGSVLMFVPVTEYRMTVYSRDYFRRLGVIPPFLDKFQYQYSCCGIRNYEDYNDKRYLSMRLPDGYISISTITPDDRNWFIIQNLADGGFREVNRTKRQQRYGFEIPVSCCAPRVEHLGINCGKYVEYGLTEGSFEEEQRYKDSAKFRVNNHTLGCFKKYETILNGGRSFQLPWLMLLLRWGSFLEAVIYCLLLWAYMITVRRTRKDDDGELIIDLNEGEKYGDELESLMSIIRQGPEAVLSTQPTERELASQRKREKRIAYKNALAQKNSKGPTHTGSDRVAPNSIQTEYGETKPEDSSASFVRDRKSLGSVSSARLTKDTLNGSVGRIRSKESVISVSSTRQSESGSLASRTETESVASRKPYKS